MNVSLAVLFTSLLTLPPAVCAPGDDERLGPASAEARLREVLAQVATEAGSEAAMLGLLTDGRGPTSGHGASLNRVLDLGARLVRGDSPPAPADWPQDPGLLLLLIRGLPVSTPASWLPTLVEPLGAGGAMDAARVELIAKAPRVAARGALREALNHALRDQSAVDLQCALLHGMRYLENLDGARLLFRLQTHANPRIQYFASTAFRVVIARVTRARHHDQLATFFEQLAIDHPPGFVFHLELAAKRLREAGDLTPVRPMLDTVIEATAGHHDSGWQVNHREALLARAATRLFQGEEFAAVRADLRRAATPDRPLLAREDEVRIVCLRAELLEAFLQEVVGEDSGDRFYEILDNAPIDNDTNLLDRAWFGAFGPDFLNDSLRRRGHSAAARRAFESVTIAIEATTPLTGYGILQRDPDQEERTVSWIFLEPGRLRLEDGGDARATLELVRDRIPTLEGMSRWNNLELSVHTRILESRAYLSLRDAAGAHRTLDSARAMVEGLRTGYHREMVRMTDRGEIAPLPVESTFQADGPVYRDLLARVLLMQATVRATLEEDAAGAARDLYRAGQHMDWSVDRWMSTALDQARRGLHGMARRSLACVEPLPDQLYDQACVAAFLGEADRAVEFAHAHLEQRTYTVEGRAREVEYMAADPDLAAIHDHPNFPRASR